MGEILGLNRAVIQSIENPGSGRDPEDCIHQVFVKWFDNAPKLPNYCQYPLTWRGYCVLHRKDSLCALASAERAGSPVRIAAVRFGCKSPLLVQGGPILTLAAEQA